MTKNILSGRRRVVLMLASCSLSLISFGTLGYMIIEEFPLLDALYMTVITLTTVGFGEIRPLHDYGRVFTVVLILLGAGLLAYNLAYFSQLLLDGNLLDAYRRRKLDKTLKKLEDHYIVCGYGQMGQIIVHELIKNGLPVVVVENDESLLARLREKSIPCLGGDGTEEENLLTVGVEKAKGLVSVVSKDTDNVFIVLTARDINKKLFILSRAGAPGSEKRLLKAGADRVVSPFSIGATRIAQSIISPTVTDFLELAMSGEGMELSLEELEIPPQAWFIGKELKNSAIRSRYNLIVVAIKHRDGRMTYNPSPQQMLEAGDILVIIGPRSNLIQFNAELS